MSDFEEIKKELLQCRLCENIFPHEPRPIFQGNPTQKFFRFLRRLPFMYMKVAFLLTMPVENGCAKNGIK